MARGGERTSVRCEAGGAASEGSGRPSLSARLQPAHARTATERTTARTVQSRTLALRSRGMPLRVAVAWGYVEASQIERGEALLDRVAGLLHGLGARRS